MQASHGFGCGADKSLDGADTLLTEVAVASLAAGESLRATVAVTIPSYTPPSKRFIIAQADGTGIQPKADEGNNTKTKANYDRGRLQCVGVVDAVIDCGRFDIHDP